MQDEELKRLIDVLSEGFKRLGVSTDDLSGSFDDITDAAEKEKRILESVGQTYNRVNKQLEKGRVNQAQLADTIRQLDDHLDELSKTEGSRSDNIKREIALRQRQEIAERYREAARAETFKKAGAEIKDSLVKGAATGAKSFASNLQDNASSVKVAGDLLSGGIDGVSGGLASAGEGLKDFGVVTRIVGKGVGGLPAMIIGGALELLGKVGGTAFREGLSLVIKEAEKTVESFHKVTSAGAMFAQGMGDVRNYAREAGLTVEDFADVVKNTSGLLAESGLTVTEAAKKMAGITKEFADKTGKSGLKLRDELQNLGFGIKEQAELSAITLSNLKRSGLEGQLSNSQLAQSTVDMAKNMKIVANILGEEAAAREETAKRNMQNARFLEIVNEQMRKTGDINLPNTIAKVFSMATPALQRAVVQYVTSGGSITDMSAILAEQGPTAARLGELLMSGVTSFEGLAQPIAQLNDQMQMGLTAGQRAMSTVTSLTGEFAEETGAVTDQYLLSFKADSKNLMAAMAATESAAGTTAELQKGFRELEKQVYSLRIRLQELLDGPLSKFPTWADRALSVAKAALYPQSIPEQIGQYLPPGPTLSNPLEGAASVVPGGGFGVTLGKIINNTIADIFKNPPAGNVGEAIEQMPGQFAEGGISTGPLSGYQAQLHGTEAVVPLPDGKTIPVDVRNTADAQQIVEVRAAGAEQSARMQELVDELKSGNRAVIDAIYTLRRSMERNNDLTSGILQSSY